MRLQKLIPDYPWVKMFPHYIIGRAYDYYGRDYISEMQVNDENVTAKVEGENTYDVKITYKDGKILNMSCSCPHAESGKRCKHMAAILFKWSKEYEVIFNAGEDTNLKDMVSQASDEEVREYLTKLLQNNKQDLLRFKIKTQKALSEDDLQAYSDLVEEITVIAENHGHEIQAKRANEYAYRLMDLLAIDVRLMIENKLYMEAFWVVTNVFSMAAVVFIDKSTGGVYCVGKKSYELWNELLEKANEEQRNEMIKAIKNIDSDCMHGEMECYLDDIKRDIKGKK